jgi:hypothetical protein
MYHNTIIITLAYNDPKSINFNYSFVIYKNEQSIEDGSIDNINRDHAYKVNYYTLMNKFSEIGFNTKYLEFENVNLHDDVFCSYNYQPDIDRFFLAYKKSIRNINFDIGFQYGVIIDGRFYLSHMNDFSSVYFLNMDKLSRGISIISGCDDIINGKKYKQTQKTYQLVDKKGNIINKLQELININPNTYSDTKREFFDSYNVKVYMRKYKLSRLLDV